MWYPPACTQLPIFATIKALFHKKQDSLETTISDFLNARFCVTGHSWVILLGLFLKTLSLKKKRNEVILARHSCYEFTKAIFAAGLVPVYVDIEESLEMSLVQTEAAVSSATLAVLSINNCGIASNNRGFSELCRKYNICHIEDATYTFGGYSNSGELFGTFGDIAILNFSEGKIVPVGGGAIVCNTPDSEIEQVTKELVSTHKTGTFAGLFRLLRYAAGSSSIGYTCYQIIRKISGMDMKRRMSMEKTRKEKNITLTLFPIPSASAVCGVEIIRRFDELRNTRYQIYLSYKRHVKASGFFPVFSEKAMIVRVPFIAQFINAGALCEAEKLGVRKLYSENSPLYTEDNVFPNARNTYYSLITLPAHHYITPKIIKEIERAVHAVTHS